MTHSLAQDCRRGSVATSSLLPVLCGPWAEKGFNIFKCMKKMYFVTNEDLLKLKFVSINNFIGREPCPFIYNIDSALKLGRQRWLRAGKTHCHKGPSGPFRKCLLFSGLNQCFSTFNVHVNHSGILWKCADSGSAGVGAWASAFLTSWGQHFRYPGPSARSANLLIKGPNNEYFRI